MFIDARRIAEGATIDCDVCIIGSGAAGITIGRQFDGKPTRLCVLESGDLELDGETQELYDGENIGLPYYNLDVCRLRFFGGTTNHWGGYCLPFKQHDFEKRPWIPNSGWPIGLADLWPYYLRAAQDLGLPDVGWRLDHWESKMGYRRLPLDGENLATDMLYIRKVIMGTRHRKQFAESQNVHVYLNANVVEIETDEFAQTASTVRVRTLTGNQFRVAGRYFILASGGIENPRLLLLSNRVQKNGLGNQYDVVGRYFAEDPGFIGAVIKPADPRLDVDLYFKARNRYTDGTSVRGYLYTTESAQRRHEIAPVAILFETVPDPRYESAGVRSLRSLRREFAAGQWPQDISRHIGNVIADIDDVATLTYDSVRYWEFPPIDRINCVLSIKVAANPESRVTLGEERDALGQRRVRLDWRLTEFEKRSARKAVENLAIEVARAGIGRVQSLVDGNDATWPDDLEGVFHHIGTTRMSDDPRTGVVDRNCKLHGVANLYVAGSSVFSTSGSGTPTITIMALAIRLADHLKERLT